MSKSEVYDREQGKCFFCGKELTFEEATLEHLLAKIHGGNNTLHNTTIACSECNRDVGQLPIVQKILLRDMKMLFTGEHKKSPPKVTTIEVGDVKIKFEE